MRSALAAAFGSVRGFARRHLSDQALLLEHRSSVAGPYSLKAGLIARLLGSGTAAGRNVSEDTADNHSAVFACVDLLAKTVGSLPCKLYRKTPTGREHVDDHPASQLLRIRPNDGQTPMQFRAFGQRCIGLRGNFYARIVRDAFFRPTALIPIESSSVQPFLADGQRLRFRISGGDTLVPRVDLLHVPWIHGDGWVGSSPIACMREGLGLAFAAEEYGARFFANDSRPPGVLSTEQELSDEQIIKLREQWQAAQAAGNRHKTAVLANGLKYAAIGMSNEDAQFLETRKFQIEEVARFYGVPLALLQSTEKSTSWGSGIDSLIQGFVKFTLAPLLTQWEQALTLSLLTEEEIAEGLYFRFALDGLLRGDLKARSEALQIQRQNGIINANEWRAIEEMNELPDHQGGVYLAPLNFGELGKAQPAAQSQMPNAD